MTIQASKGVGVLLTGDGSGGAGPPGPPGPPGPAGPAGASFIGLQVLSSPAVNYTPGVDVSRIVAVITGGGGGGARSAQNLPTGSSAGGGGGAGASVMFSANVTPLVPIPITIGTGGAPGAAPNDDGSAGTATTMLGRTAGGGDGGKVEGQPPGPPLTATGGMTRLGGAGGIAAGVGLLLNGEAGGPGVQVNGNSNTVGGRGGSSYWGGGGWPYGLQTGWIGPGPFAGQPGGAPGAGGGGTAYASTAGVGANGVIVIWEYSSGGGGGGGDLFEYIERGDFSVNKASVDNAWSANPVIKTQTGTNAAGGFNGGGTGNKTILGINVGDGLALGALNTIEYTWRPLVPYVTTPFQPFVNLVCELGAPAPAGYKILVIDPAAVPALNVCTTVNNGDGTFTTTWDASIHFLQVVLDVPGYPPGVPLPAVNLNPVGSWLNRSYDIAAIAAAYPLAALRRAASADGGMPAATITPAFMIVGGDSGNNRIQAWEITEIFFNGVQV